MFVTHALLCAVLVLGLTAFRPSNAEAQAPLSPDNTLSCVGDSCTYVRCLPGTNCQNWYLLHGLLSWRSTPATKRAVVLNFHGLNQRAEGQDGVSGMNAFADAAGFYVVYPQGKDFAWNAGPNCCRYPNSGTRRNDVQFVKDILYDLEFGSIPGIGAVLPAFNTKRVFATGISNGGMMAYRLGCEEPTRIAAIAPVNASLDVGQTCDNATNRRPVPLVHFHPVIDAYIPLWGGAGLPLAGAPPSFRAIPFDGAPVSSATEVWSTLNRCSTTQGLVSLPANGGPMECYAAQTLTPMAPPQMCPLPQAVSLCLTSSGWGSAHEQWPPSANSLMWTYVFTPAANLP